MGGGERGEGCHCHPSDLLCWLTVIWSGAPTDSLGGAPTPCYFLKIYFSGVSMQVKSSSYFCTSWLEGGGEGAEQAKLTLTAKIPSTDLFVNIFP